MPVMLALEMASLKQDRQTVETILCENTRFYTTNKEPTLTVFDRERDQYLIHDEGWDGYQRIHRTWVHMELREGKFWIHKDGTQDGIATEFLAVGVPKERIVLAFQHPTRREQGEFATQ